MANKVSHWPSTEDCFRDEGGYTRGNAAEEDLLFVTVASERRLILSEHDTRLVLDWLDKPREANARMVAALKTMPRE